MANMDMAESVQQEQAQPEMAQAQQTAHPMQQEKMLTQDEVNKLVGRVRHDGYEKGRRDAQAELQGSQMSNPQITEDKLREMMREEAARVQEEQIRQAMAQQLIGEFAAKMAAGKDKYEDFEHKVAALDLAKIPEIIQLANGTDNAADVMYELANKPYKIGNILGLYARAPHLAIAEMNNLASSIKSNQQAAQQAATPPEPMSQFKPSIAAGDNGKLSVRDFRKASYLRR